MATITLHRPERLNAWTAQMNAEYRSLPPTGLGRPAVRVIVVTGCGRGFCAGAESDDLAGHAERGTYRSWDSDELARPGYGVRPEFDAELAYHFGIPKPIIAAVNGPAAGIGFALSCYCDVRIAASGAKLTTAHGKLGLPCAFGLAWLLPKLIGHSRALELVLSSRTFTAEEALEMGLVATVVAGDQLAGPGRRIRAACWPPPSPRPRWPPPSARCTRPSTSRAAEAVAEAEALLDPMMAGPDYREGVAALREKRPPRFSDLSPG